MPSMTDPMDALKSFAPEFRAKNLVVEKGRLDPTLWVHMDQPLPGEQRITYAQTKSKKVLGIAILSTAEPFEGAPCFGLGYAVCEDERGKGIAKNLVQAALAEFADGLAKAAPQMTFYIEL